jgi:UDP-N-acetylmuramoyl-tripeptide--D-alanyl-D-alanine ligase
LINADTPFYPLLARRAEGRHIRRILSFGTAESAWARLISATPRTDGHGLDVEAHLGGRSLSFHLAVPGRHWALNALATLATVSAMGADVGRAALTLGAMEAPAGRGRRHDVAMVGGYFALLDESYNASPAAMRAAFAAAGAVPLGSGGRRIAVLGDMLELGSDAERFHAELADALREQAFDLVLTAGPLMRALHRALPVALQGTHADRAEDLTAVVRALVRPGDVVVVKGSHGMHMDQIVTALIADAEAPLPAANGN